MALRGTSQTEAEEYCVTSPHVEATKPNLWEGRAERWLPGGGGVGVAVQYECHFSCEQTA